MLNSQSDFFRETADAAVRFLAETSHRNVAKLFQNAGYTCELDTEKGSFFESVVLDESELTAYLKLYWGISVNEEYRKETEAFVNNINGFLTDICTVSIDSSGRLLSGVELSYGEKALSCKDFADAEKACYVTINLFSTAAARLNCSGELDDEALYGIIDAFRKSEGDKTESERNEQ